MNVGRVLTHAEGFLDLGMLEEAWNKTEELPPIDRVVPFAVELRILTAMKEWELGEGIANVLLSSAVESQRCRETITVPSCPDTGSLLRARIPGRKAGDPERFGCMAGD